VIYFFTFKNCDSSGPHTIFESYFFIICMTLFFSQYLSHITDAVLRECLLSARSQKGAEGQVLCVNLCPLPACGHGYVALEKWGSIFHLLLICLVLFPVHVEVKVNRCFKVNLRYVQSNCHSKIYHSSLYLTSDLVFFLSFIRTWLTMCLPIGEMASSKRKAPDTQDR